MKQGPVFARTVIRVRGRTGIAPNAAAIDVIDSHFEDAHIRAGDNRLKRSQAVILQMLMANRVERILDQHEREIGHLENPDAVIAE